MDNPLTHLHRFIVNHFDREELRTLCMDLGVNYDGLPGEGTTAKARELVLHLGRQQRLDALLTLIRQARPKVYAGDGLRDDQAALEALYKAMPAFEAGEPVARVDSPDYAEARARYLDVLSERYNAIETHAYVALAQDEQVGSPQRLELLGEEGVYVPLTFDPPAGRREMMEQGHPGKDEAHLREMAEREMQPLGLADVLDLPGHLAIIGDAGCGKTTILRVIVSALAAENPTAIAPDMVSTLPDLLPIPIFLPLRLFEHACADGYAPQKYNHCVADLLRFLDDRFKMWCPTVVLPAGFFSQHILAGRAWLLLDALDEVADPRHRQAVRGVIHDLADQLRDARLLVTARVAAYRDACLDDRFSVVTIRDLNEEQRTRMVHAIYRGLALPDPKRRAADLDERFQSSAALRDLTRTPVMVWTAAVIHALRGKLPEGRAALYDAYVDILLKKSFEHARDDTVSLGELVGGQDFSLQDRRHYLSYAAFQAHLLLEAHPERHPAQEDDRTVLVGEDELVDEVLAPYFQDKMYLDSLGEARQCAQTFVSLMVERSGLLYETRQGYTIGDHLTMQEFLAGCYLGDHYRFEDPQAYTAFLKDKVDRSWWREVFLLAAGYLAEQGFKAPKFLEEIARQGEEPKERLAALALAARGLLQLRAHVQRPTWYAGLARGLAGRLYQHLYAEPAPAAVALRQEAGLALGLLYGYPDEEGSPDPRFVQPGGLPDFVRIEAGWFWMGDDDSSEEDERPRHRVYLDTYELARFPTTNTMFARFIADDGYKDPRWWPEAIQDEYWSEEKGYQYGNLPRYWDDPRFNNPAQPVVGVSWYEVVAYCRWLTATLDDGYTYRLPTEAQWERTARGTEGWVYPWGDEWREDHCNSEEAGLGVTSPVGLFPKGAAQGGLEDMAGNVWEWCHDWYSGDYYAQSKEAHNPTGPEKGGSRVVRGGSWYNKGQTICRCGYRYGYFPWVRLSHWGFRCSRTSSS